MKKAILLLSLCCILANGALARADDSLPLQLYMTEVSPADLINWKVGDSMDYSITLGMFGNLGTSNKSVTKDEGAAIWVRQTMAMKTQNETVDILINKADGKILKLIRNGKEEAIPDEQLEIISQDYTEITVPAGKFSVLHVVAKTKNVSKIEIWANPPQTVMDGVVKQIITTQFGDLTMELTKFQHGG